jgi:polysaccharide biosynthesis transport protein
LKRFRPPQQQEHLPEPELFLEEGGGSELNLAEYVDVLRRRWGLVVLFLLVCVTAGMARYIMSPKMYQASTRIQIDRRSMSLGGTLEAPWLENWWNMEFYPTQYKLLESRGMAERVVTDLRLYEDTIFNPGWASWAQGEGAEGGTRELDEAALGRLGSRLLGGLQVSPIRQTQLVDITYRSLSPELAARVANGLADAYIEWGIQSRSDSAVRASSFLDQQIDALRQEVGDKEAQLRAYGRTSDMVMDAQTNPTLQRLDAMNRDYISAVSARINAEARHNEVMSAPKESIADPLSGGLVSQLRRELLNLEQEYATRLNVYKPEMPVMVELRGRMEEMRSHMATVVSEMVEQARRTAQAELSTARRRERALAEELEKAKDESLEMGSAAVQYNNLLMEISTRRGLLNELLQRQSETEVSVRMQANRESNVRVVDRALMPRGPYSPNLRNHLGMAVALGLFLGVGCVFLLEYLDRTVKSAEQAERLLGLPVLAVIPDVSDGGRYGYGYGSRYAYGYGEGNGKRRRMGALPWRDKRSEKEEVSVDLLPQNRPRHAVSEAYRSLRTGLLLSSAEQLRIIAVTSAQSGEGKTATAANLAVVLAQLGRRVLLVDADLRKPRLHKVFRVSNRAGLVHALTGGGELADVVQETPIPGLAVVPSGTIPPNPSELLASERMHELMEQALRAYDIVLVDTPPVLAVTDAALVGARVDGVVYCLQAGRVLREEAKASTERLQMAGVRVLGLVLNRYVAVKGVDPKHYYYYHYQASPEEEAAGEKSGTSAA